MFAFKNLAHKGFPVRTADARLKFEIFRSFSLVFFGYVYNSFLCAPLDMKFWARHRPTEATFY